MNYPTMLSSYSPEDHGALEALKVPGLHRWNGAVALYQTGLPSQDAMLVDGRKSDAVLHGEITEFFRRMHSQGMNVMGIRLDKVGAPHLPPSHAGLPEDARAVVEILRKDIAAGFVPALNVWSDYRYNFRGAMAVTFTDAESLVIDFVGPGYCGAGLSKGMITPPVEISTKSYAPPLSELVKEHRAFMHFYMDIKDEAKILSMSDLAAARENRLHLQLQFLAKMDGRSVEDEVKWLYEKGWTFLFDRPDVEYDAGLISKLFDFAQKYAEYMKSKNRAYSTHTLGLHIARDGRILFDNMWDKHRGN